MILDRALKMIVQAETWLQKVSERAVRKWGLVNTLLFLENLILKGRCSPKEQQEQQENIFLG